LDPNKRDEHGLAPLHVAAKHGSLAVLEELLDRKEVDVELKSTKGYPHLLADTDIIAAEECRRYGLPEQVHSQMETYMLRIMLAFAKDKDKVASAELEREKESREREVQQAIQEGRPWMDLPTCQEVVPPKEHQNGCHDRREAMVHAINSIHSPCFTEILNASGELVRSTSPGSEEKKFWKGMHADYINDDDDYGQTALH
jgi:ankyrin repeat protein